MTNTINRAELTGIAAALTNKYIYPDCNGQCMLPKPNQKTATLP